MMALRCCPCGYFFFVRGHGDCGGAEYFTLKELTTAAEAKIRALVKKAVS